MTGQLGHGEQFEDDKSKHTLPTCAKDSDGDRREEPPERVEKAFLSRIDDIPHNGHNSFCGFALSIRL